jgi:predicted HAD superfamily phosphohydrolase YqeG
MAGYIFIITHCIVVEAQHMIIHAVVQNNKEKDPEYWMESVNFKGFLRSNKPRNDAFGTPYALE